MTLSYRGYFIGTSRMDFFVKELVMYGLKVIEKLEGFHNAITINYCEPCSIDDGLIINFDSQSLDLIRVYNKNIASPGNYKIPVHYKNTV